MCVRNTWSDGRELLLLGETEGKELSLMGETEGKELSFLGQTAGKELSLLGQTEGKELLLQGQAEGKELLLLGQTEGNSHIGSSKRGNSHFRVRHTWSDGKVPPFLDQTERSDQKELIFLGNRLPHQTKRELTHTPGEANLHPKGELTLLVRPKGNRNNGGNRSVQVRENRGARPLGLLRK